MLNKLTFHNSHFDFSTCIYDWKQLTSKIIINNRDYIKMFLILTHVEKITSTNVTLGDVILMLIWF